MTATSASRIAICHLDESCLGNGREGDNPGGGGGLIEMRTRAGIQRRDLYLSAPATTNNRMALAGAAETLEVLAARGARLRVLIVSDSEYLVRGMREWAPGWERRGWTRKGGAIENLPLWQRLVAAARLHDTQFTWVRGHKGHAKNEYANDLAVRAAREQLNSGGAVESGFPEWLDARRKKKLYLAYDPDQTFTALERRVASGERFPHADALSSTA
ncbi:MAG TPA: ribonuclease H [Gemmatimonadales bacterium]|nr:ribonuclease H [Gemmatimonadales bacterium]